MIKKERGITLVSLVITVVLMVIIASTVVDISLDRFEINKFNKMKNDIQLLEDKVASYYLKFGSLPILRNADTNEFEKYPIEKLDFTRNSEDDENYYIIDLKAMEGITLNYGETGLKEKGLTEDIYIINSKTHTIYYVKGIEVNGTIYHFINKTSKLNEDIPPSKPQINIVSGTKNSKEQYTTNVKIEIIDGKDNLSGIGGTEYSLDNGNTWLEYSELLEISTEGTHIIKAKTYDASIQKNYSEESKLEFQIKHHLWDSGKIIIQPTCEQEGTRLYTCTDCGDTYIEPISVAGHSYTSTVTKEPTCTEEGIITYTCKNCGDSYTESISVAGHSYDEGEITQMPTCEKNGIKTFTCEYCGDSYTEPIAAAGHMYKETVTKEPTAEEEGEKTYECINCGNKYTETISPIGSKS